MSANGLSWLLLIGFLGLSVMYDGATRRIPNWLVLLGLVAGIASNAFGPVGDGTLALNGGGLGLCVAVLGALVGLLMLMPIHLVGAMGAGDVKLMAAIGAYVGPNQVVGVALLTLIAGGVLSILAALFSRSLPRVFMNLRLIGFLAISGRASGMSLRDVQTTGRLPYAIAIAVGTALQLWLARHGGWPFV